MKTPDEKKTEVTATTKARLTIRGQTFEMTMEELKSLHDKIGKVTGQDKPTVIFAPSENDKARQRERPFYPPSPHWYGPPPAPYQIDVAPFLDPTTRPMCIETGDDPRRGQSTTICFGETTCGAAMSM